MNQVFSQVRRIFTDDGRGDKDFAEQEARLLDAQNSLIKAADQLRRASEILTDLITSRKLNS